MPIRALLLIIALTLTEPAIGSETFNDGEKIGTCRQHLTSRKYRLLHRISTGQLEFYESEVPGQLGGYWRGREKIYGRLDCPSALRWIAKGHYVRYRVFFATEQDAQDAGFRPCSICMLHL